MTHAASAVARSFNYRDGEGSQYFRKHDDQAKLAKAWETLRLKRIIQSKVSAASHTRNPYRAILRREYPEPLIALLAFILGIWLWDLYFGKTQGYPPGSEEIALVKIDRDLRLADAMHEDPAWLKWIVGVETPATERGNAMIALRKLAKESAMTTAGLEAFGIIKAEQEHKPVRETLAEVMHGEVYSDFNETSERLATHRGTWWNAKLIEDWEKTMRPSQHWHEIFGNECQQLRGRAIFVRGFIWLLGLAGLALIPSTLRHLTGGLRGKTPGYGGAWPLPLGLVIFLVATLAWIGFTMTLEIGISTLPGLHPAVGIMLDSAARLLPSLIALGLLFRRPSHAVRVLGLNRPIAAKIIFGLFSLLMLLDQVLRNVLGGGGSTEPGGGLSAGDAGLWGLAFGVVSACMLAPLAEELLYRGVLFQSFRNRLGVLPAAILSSAIFSVLHIYDGYGLASVGVFGFSCALLYAATGSIGAAIALHMLYNTAIKIPEWLIYHGPLG
jgi:membrane protease YdiL (CAAX protease family)